MLKKIMFEYTMAVALLIGIGGCSSNTPKVEEFADTANLSDEVQRLAKDVQTARERQVAVLAPAAFEDAEDAWKSATEAQRKGKDRKDILHTVAVGRAYLNRANQFADLARNNMEDVAVARQAAISAGAARSFPDEFNKIDNDLRDVTSRVEKNDLSEISPNRASLQKSYLDMELKAIKQANLGMARMTIAQAIQEGAKDYAKQSLAIAEKAVADADAFIVANRHQTESVKSRSQAATNSANHLLKITRMAKAGENITPEELALKLDAEQRRAQQEREQLTAEQARTQSLTTQTRGLKSAQAFNQSFESARAEFTVDEAEVYRQGNNLVIRLRALEFPVNQSVLKGSNFPLLSKVTKVLEDFPNPTVTVEGHTDSDGGKALNQKLSLERAQAVKEYLVANGSIDEESITAVGYGFDRPLASNKTAKGKAQNRRVDIVITPQLIAE